MNCIAAVSFTQDRYWMVLGCSVGYLLLTLWSVRGVRQGKPAIPKHILILTPLMAYLIFLEFSLPYVNAPETAERDSRHKSSEERSIEESNRVLRRDLDDVRHDLDKTLMALEQLKEVNRATLNLAWLAVLTIICKWLGPRTDDRNWIHGGIRPPPGTQIDEEPQSENRTER